MRIIRRHLAILALALVMSFGLASGVLAQSTETTSTAASRAVSVTGSGKKAYLVYTDTGEKVTGQGTGAHKVNGSYYYFIGRKGRIYVNTWIYAKSATYYATADGTLATGFTKIGKASYYFKPYGAGMVTSWRKIKGSWYYFSKEKKTKGQQQFGLKTIGKSRYYLDPKKNGARAEGWKKISGKFYYFDEKGRMKKNGIFTISGKKYYLDSNGIRRTGLVTVRGSTYYFAPSMKTGWRTVKGKKYYFSSGSGRAVTGWLTSNGRKYYFGSSGAMMKGWATIDGSQYYFDLSTGAMYTGTHTISGISYNFGTNGKVQLSGAYSIRVNLTTCVVTVYRGSTPVRAMRCSPAKDGVSTPTGTFSLGLKRHWHELFGGVYGQYTTQITGNILFHSVYYYRYKDIHSLSTTEFEKLGSPASAGCIRLDCADAYFIYTYCPVGTKCTIFRGSSSDDPLGKPAQIHLNGKNYDPTDPIPND